MPQLLYAGISLSATLSTTHPNASSVELSKWDLIHTLADIMQISAVDEDIYIRLSLEKLISQLRDLYYLYAAYIHMNVLL